MDRRARILEYIPAGAAGIEIGAWFAPLVPKAAGWRTLVLDVFPTPDLRRRAAADPKIPDAAIPNIEEVDLVGSATEIARLAADAGVALGSLDFVVSSHNFEHLPDPIRFLQGVGQVLKPGGVLSMAVPDCRTCFDHIRPHSTLAELLDAYFSERQRPTPAQVFDYRASEAVLRKRQGGETDYFPLHGFDGEVLARRRLQEHFAEYLERMRNPAADYVDAHCWTFTPASLHLLLAELRSLGLIRLKVEKITGNNGVEFYVHLRREDEGAAIDSAADAAERHRLLQGFVQERRPSGWSLHRMLLRLAHRIAPVLRGVLPSPLYDGMRRAFSRA